MLCAAELHRDNTCHPNWLMLMLYVWQCSMFTSQIVCTSWSLSFEIDADIALVEEGTIKIDDHAMGSVWIGYYIFFV